jgi:tetratricopeptide (TPR) repeat protein
MTLNSPPERGPTSGQPSESLLPHGFLGREGDRAHLEERLLQERNLVLVRGPAGAGKSALLRQLGTWWQGCGLVGQVFSFGYDERAWTRAELLAAVGARLFGEQEYHSRLQPLSEELLQEEVVRKLRAERHLLTLDNLESITGSHLAILHPLSAQEQRALQAFLSELAGGNTLVVLGSRGEERWLAPGTFEDNVYELAGLDAQAASTLAQRILEHHQLGQYREDTYLEPLLEQLGGYPLALEVVLGRYLKDYAPLNMVAQFEGVETAMLVGVLGLCYGHVSPEARRLLLCLAPFTGMVNRDWVKEPYTELLEKEPGAQGLPFERWGEVLEEAVHYKLLTPDEHMLSYLHINPALHYLLRTRLGEEPELERAANKAFHLHQQAALDAMMQLMLSSDPEERNNGLLLTKAEADNFLTLLWRIVGERGDIGKAFWALYLCLDSLGEMVKCVELCESVLSAQERYLPEQRVGLVGLSFLRVYAQKGDLWLMMGRHEEAREIFEQVLEQADSMPEVPEPLRVKARANARHRLGWVAHEEHQWEEAERQYLEALRLQESMGDAAEQAQTCHNLGVVARARRQWEKAEQYYQRALQLKTAFHNVATRVNTYHELGLLAEEQHQWKKAQEWMLKCLEGAVQYNNQYYLSLALKSLAQLREPGKDSGLVGKVAKVLGTTRAQAEKLLQRGLPN